MRVRCQQGDRAALRLVHRQPRLDLRAALAPLFDQTVVAQHQCLALDASLNAAPWQGGEALQLPIALIKLPRQWPATPGDRSDPPGRRPSAAPGLRGLAMDSTSVATSLGLPSVMVPVLSSAMALSLRAPSR